MDTRPPNIWFIASYVLLVVIAACGFYWQAQTIDTLEDQQQQIDEQARDLMQVVEFEQTRVNNAAILTCRLMLDLVEPEERETVVAAFAAQHVKCEADLKSLPPPPDG